MGYLVEIDSFYSEISGKNSINGIKIMGYNPKAKGYI
jgi:hypothetical protein